MPKIPFNIKFKPQIESGEYKVETRDGKPTRIVCWDLKGNEDFFILALVEKNEKEVSYCYPATGYCYCKAACDQEGKDDLFIITPEPELTEWQRSISACLQKHGLLDCGAADRIAKESAAELLDLAREELFANDTVLKEYAEEARKQGKAEAMKDLPRWKKAKEYMKLGLDDFCFTLDNNGKMSPYWDTEIEKGQYYITEADLEKLPKED